MARVCMCHTCPPLLVLPRGAQFYVASTRQDGASVSFCVVNMWDSITVLEDENVPRLTVGDHAVLLDSKQGVERSRDVSH